MERVGVRDLKNRLAHYLRVVRRGQGLLVTSRGKPVARLLPAHAPGAAGLPAELEERLWELAAKGVLVWSGERGQLPEPAAVNRGGVLLSDLVVEDRE